MDHTTQALTDARHAEALEDYDSGAGWQRVTDAMERHGCDAVLADPTLVEDAPCCADYGKTGTTHGWHCPAVKAVAS